MRQAIHYHYDQLTERERECVDIVFERVHYIAENCAVPLAGDDRVERAVDAMARAVIESRKVEVYIPDPKKREPI